MLRVTRRLTFILVIIGFIWAMTLINMSLVSTSTQTTQQLQNEILSLSEKYIRQLASQSQDVIDGPYAGRLTGYDLKKTMAVLLENILMRVDRLEQQVFTRNTSAIPERSNHQSADDTARIESSRNLEERKVEEKQKKETNRLTAKDLIKGVQENCSLTQKEIKDYPHCRGKMEWMKAHWQSDKCYSLYGVDGTQCSFRVYLSEVENWCPLLPGRKPLYFNDTDSTLTRVANINYDLDTLMFKLQDPVNREENYAWIRQRITRNWPGWVEGMKQLAQKQDMTNRKQKKVLVHLGLLSKKSGFKIAENSFKGGPLGELVQWSDIISCLFLLGHDIVITSEVEQLAGILSKLPTAESQCQTRQQLPIHIIYIDIVGLTQFKRRVKAGYGKFSCLLRIIDSFGTEPAFNFEPYAKSHKLKTTWGMQNLNPQQFFTMFPHSPDNSFMGFVVEEHLNESESKIEKKDQAVVYGKAEYMWQGKEDYLSVIHKYLEIHGTVFTNSEGPSVIPGFVHNHGILPGPELHRLLRQSKLFIGLGFPYEGPAPLEAIAQGCVFINPQFNPPHNSQNTKFFKGKPTFRKVTSQHPYAEEFIGEPRVYTVDITDKQTLEQVLLHALDDINLNKVQPYMPYEFTKEGMLQRVNAYIEHQDFCQPNTIKWPSPQDISYVLSQPGASCQQTCRSRDLICEPSYFKLINSRVSIEKQSGQVCADVIEAEDIFYPGYNPVTQRCFLQKQPMLFSCVGELEGLVRLCPCRNYIPGQTALCKHCV